MERLGAPAGAHFKWLRSWNGAYDLNQAAPRLASRLRQRVGDELEQWAAEGRSLRCVTAQRVRTGHMAVNFLQTWRFCCFVALVCVYGSALLTVVRV